MNKPELMKQLESAIDDAIAQKMWGLMKITWRDGEPELLRTESTRKFNDGGKFEQNHAKSNFR
jgi:hypothetical protein